MLSIVIPIHNEEHSILPLYDRLTSVLEQIQRPYEIIFIDDASTDRSFELLANLVETDARLKVIRLRRNFGQTAALSAGFQSLARGAGRHFGGGDVRQTIIEMTSGFLFVMAAGHGTCLAVLTSADPDVGQVAYEMAILVQRTGEHLQVNMRTPSALCG